MRAAFALLVLVCAGLVAAVALAGNGKPQKKINAADQARAKAIALTRGDVGSGWTAEKSSGSDGSSPRCSYYNPDQSDLVETGDYESPNFTRPDGAFVSSSVGIFKTSAQGKTAYQRVVRPELPRCLGEIFAKGTGNPKAVKIVSAGPLSFPSYKDRSDAYRVVATLKTSSGTSRVTLDIVLINRGRVDVAIILIGVGKPLAAGYERSLAGKVAARMG